jgi:cell division protein FtsW (lipid II flippase)
MDFIQPVIGAILILAAGLSITTVFFKKDFDFIEKAVLSVVLGLAVPTIIIIVLSLGLQIKFTEFLVYAVYLLVIVVPLAYLKLAKKA